eukprot:1465573-Rhodomonas_salina.1
MTDCTAEATVARSTASFLTTIAPRLHEAESRMSLTSATSRCAEVWITDSTFRASAPGHTHRASQVTRGSRGSRTGHAGLGVGHGTVTSHTVTSQATVWARHSAQADDAVERGAQLVRDAREEEVLRLLDGDEVSLRLLERGDVVLLDDERELGRDGVHAWDDAHAVPQLLRLWLLLQRDAQSGRSGAIAGSDEAVCRFVRAG